MSVELKVNELDGRKIAYHSDTVFIVQVGFRKKGTYRTERKFTGSLPLVVLYYNAINIGCGYKKRLLMGEAQHIVLARAQSGEM